MNMMNKGLLEIGRDMKTYLINNIEHLVFLATLVLIRSGVAVLRYKVATGEKCFLELYVRVLASFETIFRVSC